MYILLTSFFISLLGIIIMIGRKLAIVRGGQIVESEHAHPFVPDIQKIKYLTIENIKKYEHLALVFIVRSYVRAVKFLKLRYEEIKIKIKNISVKNKNGSMEEGAGQEVSGFLKIMSDYKHKIRAIKHKIKEEEKDMV